MTDVTAAGDSLPDATRLKMLFDSASSGTGWEVVEGDGLRDDGRSCPEDVEALGDGEEAGEAGLERTDRSRLKSLKPSKWNLETSTAAGLFVEGGSFAVKSENRRLGVLEGVSKLKSIARRYDTNKSESGTEKNCQQSGKDGGGTERMDSRNTRKLHTRLELIVLWGKTLLAFRVKVAVSLMMVGDKFAARSGTRNASALLKRSTENSDFMSFLYPEQRCYVRRPTFHSRKVVSRR